MSDGTTTSPSTGVHGSRASDAPDELDDDVVREEEAAEGSATRDPGDSPHATVTSERVVAGPPRAAPRRARLVIRRVSPWSVLKFSLIFYFCVMLVVYIAFWIIYSVATATGSIDRFIELMEGLAIVDKGFEVNQSWVLSRAFTFGLGMVVLWSIINVFVSFLYNLISAVVGGIEVTLAEKH
jgi:transmembrane protein DUF3566